MRFRKVPSLDEIRDLRDQYLEGLIEAQELFLEMKVRAGRILIIEDRNLPMGYAILDIDDTLLEYYVKPSHYPLINEIFIKLLQRYDIKKALCKSFDHDLLACCVDLANSLRCLGYNFRDYVTPQGRFDPPWNEVRTALHRDFDEILSISNGLFDSSEELREMITAKHLLVYRKEELLVGCGLYQRVIADRNAFDIGMAVHPAHRNKGIGTAIIRHLVTQVESENGRPVAGCAAENVGSRRSLERAGFISRYRMLEFGFQVDMEK